MKGNIAGLFDSLADLRSRNLIFKESITDLLYDYYNNTFRNKTVFKGIILSGYVDGNATVKPEPPEGVDQSTFRSVYEIRPLEVHGRFLDNPLEIDEKVKDAFIEFKGWVRMHPLAYPEVDSNNNATAQFSYGDIVSFRFEEGPSSQGRLRSIKIIEKVGDYDGFLPFQRSLGQVSQAVSAREAVENGGTKSAAEYRASGVLPGQIPQGEVASSDSVAWRTVSANVTLTTEKQYDFINSLCKQLKKAGYTETVVVNSTFRSVQAQARAVVDLKKTPAQVERLYRRFKYKSQVRQILENGVTSRDQKIKELIIWIQKAKDEGIYMSAHMRSSAFDLRTKDLSFASANMLYQEVKKNAYSKSQIWEGVTDIPGNFEKRKNNSNFRVNGEHIHVSLK